MRKKDVDEYAGARHFRPFEVRLVDGQKYRFNRLEQFLASQDHILTLDRRARTGFIRIGRITTIGPISTGGSRRPRKSGGR
jgi:hypothetical protein